MDPFDVLFSVTFLSGLFSILILIIFLILFWKVIKKLVVNSVVGVFALLVLHYVFKIEIPIRMATLLVTALFGLAGVGAMLILKIGGLL